MHLGRNCYLNKRERRFLLALPSVYRYNSAITAGIVRQLEVTWRRG
jgi:hypothetical protein